MLRPFRLQIMSSSGSSGSVFLSTDESITITSLHVAVDSLVFPEKMLLNGQRNRFFLLRIISSLGYNCNVKDGKSNGWEVETVEVGGGREVSGEEEGGGGIICGGWR